MTITVFEEAVLTGLTVGDDGPGIPEEELARVVTPYYRVEGSRSRETGGAGLGLAIAKDVVDGRRAAARQLPRRRLRRHHPAAAKINGVRVELS